MNIILIGFMGSGKSTAGKLLAQHLGFAFHDLDQQIEKNAGKSIPEIFEEEGEAAFRERERAILFDLLTGNRQVISSGGGAPCWHDNLQQMKERALTVYLSLKPSAIFHRLQHHTRNRPLLKGKTDEELKAYIEETLAAREPFYTQASVIVDADCPSPSHLAERIALHLPR